MNGPLRHKKFSMKYSSDKMVHRKITMLSSIGTIRLELNGNGTTLCSSSQCASAPMALVL